MPSGHLLDPSTVPAERNPGSVTPSPNGRTRFQLPPPHLKIQCLDVTPLLLPAGMPAPGAGLGWHLSRVRRVMGIGDRWYRFAQPPATCCETFGFGQGIPCGPSFGGPRRHSPALGYPGFGERLVGWEPWDPSVGHTIRVQGRNREAKNFSSGDEETTDPIQSFPLSGRCFIEPNLGLHQAEALRL